MDIIYLNFSKAFNSISHKKLLSKMVTMIGNLWQWFESYLTSMQVPVCQDCMVTHILTLYLFYLVSRKEVSLNHFYLLFLLTISSYVLDLQLLTSKHISLYADGTKCIKSIHNSTDINLVATERH